jgi:hypothetical protein
MAAESGASGGFDERLARMEATMRQLETVQADLKSGQWWLQWAGGSAAVVLGIVAAVLVAVVVMTLERSFTLTDRMADIKADPSKVATAIDYLREDVSQIKTDTGALRSQLATVAEAVGAKLQEKKAEVAPQ